MFNIGSGELLAILLIALLVLGPDKLPDAARKVSGTLRDLRRMSQSFQDEVRQAVDLAELNDLKREITGRGAGPSLPPIQEGPAESTTPAEVPPVIDTTASEASDAPEAEPPATDAGQTGSGESHGPEARSA